MTLVKKYNRFPFFPSVFDDEFTRTFAKWPGTMHHNATIPAVNVTENEDAFIIDVAAPGLQKEDFKVELSNNILSISSEKEQTKEEKDESGSYTRKEFSYNSFQRSFTVPEKLIDQNRISGKYENGILQIVLPKNQQNMQKPNRMIEIL